MSIVMRIDARTAIGQEQAAALCSRLHNASLTTSQAVRSVGDIVSDIIEQIRLRGDSAAAELTNRFDNATLSADNLRVSREELKRAHAEADPEFLDLMREAIRNIREYQEHIKVKSPPFIDRNGCRLGLRYTAIDRVAVYVPGGKALYPSTVLMTVVPAIVAGVSEVVIVSPPSSNGKINDMVLALAEELGVKEVYGIGGAVGIAALALGTERITKVDKIVGPGNAYVAEAKRQLFGLVGIDSIAGPSEVFIVADNSAKANYLAADMLAQVEHNPGSAVLAIHEEALASEVEVELGKQLKNLSRAEAIAPWLQECSAIILTKDLADSIAWANRFATEHLQLCTSQPSKDLESIQHAGAAFLGHDSPVPSGDYFAGPSHVLPTAGTARFFGALSVNDFLKATSIIEYDPASFRLDAPKIANFAEREGLTAHAASALVRLASDEK